jgi:hypothetical protein
MGIEFRRIAGSFLRLLGNLEFGSSRSVNWSQQANARFQPCIGSVFGALGVLSPTRTLHRFWGNFRVGGDPPATRENVQNDLRKCLDEWVGDLA